MLLLAPVCHLVAALAEGIADDAVSGARNAIWKISANGLTYGNGALRQAWITPQVGMAGYSVQVTQTSGATLDVDAGQGAWLPLAVDYSWGYSGQTAPQLAHLTVQIRRDADATIVSTATITLETTGEIVDRTRTTGRGGGLFGPSLP
jgi:hypothetical protein